MKGSSSVLAWAEGLTVRPRPGGKILVSADGAQVLVDAEVLRVLEVFATPRTLAEGLERLAAAGPRDFTALSSLTHRLADSGMFTGDRLDGGPSSFDGARIHISMLDDVPRTWAFMSAIREIVTPSDVVVDVGTGTGVLAVAAALAGARHVYALEAARIAAAARAVFEANGLGHRITLIEGLSTKVTLPERATVLVAELIGDDPLDEGIIEVVCDARARHLTSDARCIPGALRVLGRPVVIPQDFAEAVVFTSDATSRWSSDYGMALSALVEFSRRKPLMISLSSQRARRWPTAGPELEFGSFDLTDVVSTEAKVRRTFEVTADAPYFGVLVYFESVLSRSISLSTAPGVSQDTNSWHSPLWLLGHDVKQGETVTVEFHYEDCKSCMQLERTSAFP